MSIIVDYIEKGSKEIIHIAPNGQSVRPGVHFNKMVPQGYVRRRDLCDDCRQTDAVERDRGLIDVKVLAEKHAAWYCNGHLDRRPSTLIVNRWF